MNQTDELKNPSRFSTHFFSPPSPSSSLPNLYSSPSNPVHLTPFHLNSPQQPLSTLSTLNHHGDNSFTTLHHHSNIGDVVPDISGGGVIRRQVESFHETRHAGVKLLRLETTQACMRAWVHGFMDEWMHAFMGA